MKTVQTEISHIYEIQKSKFITFLCPIFDLTEIEKQIEEKKKNYPGATHYCYAYQFETLSKCSDDGEPSGTAGLPILNVLKKNNLNYILCIVIRYFGGIKLGAGGLVRAYTTSVTECLNYAKIKELVSGIEFEIQFTYENKKQIDFLLQQGIIEQEQYLDTITYQGKIETSQYEKVKEQLSSLTKSIQVLKNIMITK